MDVVILVLFIAALVVGLIELFRTRAQSLPGWGIVLISGGLLLGRLT